MSKKWIVCYLYGSNIMNKIIILSGLILFSLPSHNAFAETISQTVWSLAMNNNDGDAQYKIAQAYNPSISNYDLNCSPHQFYLESKNKELRGCQNKSNEKYIEFLTKAAKNSHPNAQTNLGIAYIEGKLVTKNIQKGLYWLEKAVKAGPYAGKAQYVLGILYKEGLYVKQDYTKAIKYYELASKSKDWGFTGSAQYELYWLYKHKLNDPIKSLYWLEQSLTKMKDKRALKVTYELIEYFLNGGQADGTKLDHPNYLWAAKYLIYFVNDDKIEKNIRQKIAFQLAWFYLNGLGVEKDPEKAAIYYHLGLELGKTFESIDDKLMGKEFLLNVIKPIYKNKDLYIREFDEFVHTDLYNKKMKTLTLDNQAYATNASKYVALVFGENSEDEERFYTKLIDQIRSKYPIDSDQAWIISPILALAKERKMAYGYYQDAQRINGKTIDQLIELYQSALKLEPKNPKILYGLGTVYDFLIQEPKTAITYYQQAADSGYKLAQYRLGVIYYMGRGVKQNYREAWRYLNLAAEQNYFAAQNFLITIDKTHPDFDWLTTQYLEHEQNYRSPTVLVDGKDWLTVEKENNPTAKINYLLLKHNERRIGSESCDMTYNAAIAGDITAQQYFVEKLNRDEFHCKLLQYPLFTWIDNSNIDDDRKQFLKAHYYKSTYQWDKYDVELKSLIDKQNQYALIESTYQANRYYDNRDEELLLSLKERLKTGNRYAARLLISYYTPQSEHVDNAYQLQKIILLRNDLDDDIKFGNYDSFTFNVLFNGSSLNQRDYYYPVNSDKLSSSEVYKIWFELANMHEQGIEVPKNNSLAYVWYSLLSEHQQPRAAEKAEELKQQLTAEQLTQANNRLEQYSKLYRFIPVTHLDIH